MPARKILFVDDDDGVLKSAELLLRKAGYEFRSAHNPAEAFSLLAVEPVDVILLDLNFSRTQMSGEEGLACLREMRRHDPDAVVLVVTGHSGLTVAVQALRAGAQNFIMKPWSNDRLLEAIEDALKQVRLQGGDGPQQGEPDPVMVIGESEAMVRVRELVDRYAPLTAPVLLMGETGTGKSLVARALHRQSGRVRDLTVEAANLTAAELGELADATLVLENIEGLPPHMNLPLLSWLQTAGRSNNRVVATTVHAGADIGLQRGLLYVLSTLEILLPPVHERGNDVDLLADHFSRVFAYLQGLPLRVLSPDAKAALRGVTWQDNLHALRRVVERAMVTASGPSITPADLELPAVTASSGSQAGAVNLERAEKVMIEEALSRHNFNVSKAATDLGLTRQALYRRMARHGL